MDAPLNEAALHRLAERILRNAADRDDAIQEMWLASLENGPSGDTASDVWYQKTLRNRARRIWDRRRRRARGEAGAPPQQRVPGPDEELDRHSLHELLQSTLDQLPAAQATVIRARYFDGRSFEEIAKQEGVAAATVRSRHFRGLVEMRRRLDERTGGSHLTALALIRAFDWQRETVLMKASAGGPALLVAVGIAATLAVVSTLSWLWPGESERLSDAGDRPPVLVTDATETGATQLRSSQEAPARRPVSSAATGQTMGSGTTVPTTIAANTMRVTIRALDETGLPQQGFYAAPRLSEDLEKPTTGPAGEGGALTFLVGREHLWEYRTDSIRDTMIESTLEQGEYVKFGVLCPGTVRHPDINVPLELGTEREIEIRFDPHPATLSGRVLDRAGQPISEVLVRVSTRQVQDEGGISFDMEDALTTTSNEGRYEFDYLSPGLVRLEFSKSGLVRQVSEVLASSEAPTECSVVMDRAVAVVGRVRDDSGRPVEGARVLAERDRSQPEQWVESSADGSFVLSVLEPGAHTVWAYGPPGTPLERHAASMDLELVHDDVVWNPVLAPGSELTLLVLDPEGAPVPDQFVIFQIEGIKNDEDWWSFARTDERGRVTVDKVPEQAIRVGLHVGDHQRGVSPLAFRGMTGLWPRQEPYRLQLEPEDRNLARVRGSILWPDGSPCVGANLSIQAPGVFPVVFRNDEGHFVIEHLPAGEKLLLVERPLGGYWSTRFHVGSGQDLDLGALQLPETGTLWITNDWPRTDAEKRPLYSLTFVTVPGLEGPFQLRNDRLEEPIAGAFDFLPGEVQIYLCVGISSVDMRSVTIRSGEETVVDFVPPFDPATEELVVEEVEESFEARDR